MIAVDVYYQNGQVNALSRTNDQSAIIVVYNEKPRKYNWWSEGFEIMSGRCLVRNQVRNKLNKVETLTVEYVKETLKVYHTNEPSNTCVTVNNLKLPVGYQFGISAASGLHKGPFQVRSFNFYDFVSLGDFNLPPKYDSFDKLLERAIQMLKNGTEPNGKSKKVYEDSCKSNLFLMESDGNEKILKQEFSNKN